MNVRAMDPASVYDDAHAWYTEHWDASMRLGTWWELLAESGWAFPTWPAGRGGRGLPTPHAQQAERARLAVGAAGPPRGLGTYLVAPTLLTYGTTEQLDRYLPGIVSGRDVWCQLFSEPGAGSDLAGLSTRAERDGEEWVIDGQKVWNSGAQHARYGILMARTDPDQPKHRGISYFLIDMEQDGVDVRPLREMTGDIAFNEVFLAGASVSNDDLLGDEGDGWRVAMTTLSHERDPDNSGSGSGFDFGSADLEVTVAEHLAASDGPVDGFSMALSGGANRLLEQVTVEFDATDDPIRRQRLVELLELRRTAGWSVARSVAAVKAGGQPGPEVSTLKVIGAETARRTRDIGLESMGAEGMLWGDDAPTAGEFHAFAMFTPAMSIAGGSDEINRNIIGERVLGLPREPGEAEQRKRPWSELPRN